MSKPYDLVVFDWEGTLGDTLGQILNAFAHEASRLKLPDFDMELGRKYIVLGPVVAVRKLFPHLPTHEQSDLLQAAQLAMISNTAEVFLMSGAYDILQKIKHAGMHLAIATNKGPQSLARDIASAHLDGFFDVTRAAGQAPAKPCPQMLEEIMEQCGVSPERTLMVGDSTSDIEMAINAGVVAIGVDFYHQNEALLRSSGAQEVIDDFQQLARILAL